MNLQIAIAIIAALNAIGTALALWILSMIERRVHRLENLAMNGRAT